jgi:hypothetical protein
MIPIVSDEAVEVRNPRRALIRLVLILCLLQVVLSTIGSYQATKIAYRQSTAHTDERFRVLEKDLTERRKKAAEDNARRDQAQAEVTGLVCTVLNRLTPRDPEVERIRVMYKCVGLQPSAGTTPPPR